jgi:hypothetical protein
MTKYLEICNLLKSDQAGFRKHHSTVDNIFILHMLTDYLKHKKAKLFCAFIDIQKTESSDVWCKLFFQIYYFWKNL